MVIYFIFLNFIRIIELKNIEVSFLLNITQFHVMAIAYVSSKSGGKYIISFIL